jgi:CheY-like chemotaxis protein
LRHLQADPATCDIPVAAISANAMERDEKKAWLPVLPTI